jgi:hypothetical protein
MSVLVTSGRRSTTESPPWFVKDIGVCLFRGRTGATISAAKLLTSRLRPARLAQKAEGAGGIGVAKHFKKPRTMFPGFCFMRYNSSRQAAAPEMKRGPLFAGRAFHLNQRG